MAYFRTFCVKAQVIITIIMIIQKPAEAHTVISLPELSKVLDFLQNINSPFLAPQRSNGTFTRRSTRKTESKVEKAVLDKIAELKPYLQNIDTNKDKEEDDNTKVEDKDETTAIEFVLKPNKFSLRSNESNINTLKNNVNKYKDIRKKIKKTLLKENVSEKTTKLIFNTLDDMIGKILENKCTWPSHDSNYTQDRIDRANDIQIEWNKEWFKLKNLYSNDTTKDNAVSKPRTKLYMFFQQLYKFLEHIIQDLGSLVGKYELFCQASDPMKPGKSKNPNMDTNETKVIKKKHKCDHFMVCTEELSQFMLNFYYAVNDTTVSTLRNYAAMYVRDVNTDSSQERENLTTALHNIGDVIEHKIGKIFRKETRRFQLDKNKDKKMNIQAIRGYIKRVIENVKKYIISVIKIELTQLLIVTLIEDLIGNFDVDLGNLENDFFDRICTAFSICNGEYRRSNNNDKTGLNKSSLHVQVDMTIDDESEENILRSNLGFLDYKPKSISIEPKTHIILDSNNEVEKDKNKREKKDTDYSTIDFRRKLNVKSNFTVTRTTHIVVNSNNSTLSYQTNSKA